MLNDNLHMTIVSENFPSNLALLQIDLGDAKEFTDDAYGFKPDPVSSTQLRQTGELSFQ